MPELTIAHINREEIAIEAMANKLCEILRPKWDAKLRKEAEAFFNNPTGKKVKR